MAFELQTGKDGRPRVAWTKRFGSVVVEDVCQRFIMILWELMRFHNDFMRFHNDFIVILAISEYKDSEYL